MCGWPNLLGADSNRIRKFDFSWLQRFLDLAKKEGLSVVVGTPTAAPPKWLVDSMPEMIALDEKGLPRAFGSRRHYCFSHEGYRTTAGRSSPYWLKRWVIIRRSMLGRSTTSMAAMVRPFVFFRGAGAFPTLVTRTLSGCRILEPSLGQCFLESGVSGL